mgnify:CR=1 FL=1
MAPQPGLPSREAAWDLVCELTRSPTLRRHMLAVEAAMRAAARAQGEDEALWGAVGLLHDVDYERFPDDHPAAGEPILAAAGWPREVREAILSHGDRTGVPRDTPLRRWLHACDEVTGLVVAVALVRPDADLRRVEPRSVLKKWRNRAFAAGVDRDEVQAACDAIGVALDDHLAFVLEAMQAQAEALGLAGAGEAEAGAPA